MKTVLKDDNLMLYNNPNPNSIFGIEVRDEEIRMRTP